MRNYFLSILIFFFLVSNIQTVHASQIVLQDFSELYTSSSYIFLGEVTEVRLVSDHGIHGKEYDAKIKVNQMMKGKLGIGYVKLTLLIGGVRGFSIMLEKRGKFVFFLSSIKGDKASLTHWGSIAKFDKMYFK